ncbi:Glycosyltransferase [Butyrivibrio fibrisolvens 16/4]|nr:Glycosyltransferase [Butyrivibrio fibrisolvens 16/4]
MKLAVINAESGKGGGPATICDDIYKNFIGAGNEGLACWARQANEGDGVNRYKIGNKMDLAWHLVITRLFDAHGLGSVIATKRLVKKLKEFQPDIVNLHNIHGYFCNYKILFEYLKEADIPVVWTLHDCWPFTGHCPYFDLAGCDKWKTGCDHCPELKRYPKSIWLDRSKRNYELKKSLFAGISKNLTLVAPSAWLGDLAKESFLKDCRIEVINNGIDLQVFKPSKGDFKKSHGIENKKLVLALASEWTTRKGFEDIKYIGKNLPEDYVLTIVGLQPEQVAEVPKEIIPITRTNNVQQLIEIYSEADVFVNASVEDNFPTVILESLACGTPVVTYDTGGCREEINESCGILVEKYDKEGLIAGIKVMGAKTAERSKACIDKVQYFEKKKMYDKYNELFEEIYHKN